MNNLAKIQKLNYCQCKHSNNGHCSSVATYQVKLRSRKNDHVTATTEWSYRCEEHKNTGTNGRKIIEANPFDQSYALQKINEFLKSLIGRNIKSTYHSARWLEVKYLKNNGAVMCFQPITKKWKYVYYNQIESVLPNDPNPERSVATDDAQRTESL